MGNLGGAVGAHQPFIVVAQVDFSWIPCEVKPVGDELISWSILHNLFMDGPHHDGYSLFQGVGVLHTLGQVIVLVHEHLGEIKEHVGRDHLLLDGNGIYNLAGTGVGSKDESFAVLHLCLPKEVAQAGQSMFAIAVKSGA